MSRERAALRDTLLVALVVWMAGLLYVAGYQAAGRWLEAEDEFPAGQPGATPVAELVPTPTPLGFFQLPATPPTHTSFSTWHERTLRDSQPPSCPRPGGC